MNPLAIMCPICLSATGDECRDLNTDAVRAPHALRTGYAAQDVAPCEHCKGYGWRPAGLETKEGPGA